MLKDLGKITFKPKTGNEKLTFNNIDTGLKLLDFWKWSVSDLISNATRGRFAEFIVASALKTDLTIVRDEWSSYDLISPEGIKIEVKSSSFIQSWHQNDYSKINFSIKAARHWDSITGKQSATPMRQSDIYVFCLLKHKDQETIDPLNMNQWDFYVISTLRLNKYKRSETSITLNSLQNFTSPISYDKLKEKVNSEYKIKPSP